MQRVVEVSPRARTHVRWGSLALPALVAVSVLLLLAQVALLYSHPLLVGGVGQDIVDLYVGALAVRHGLNPYLVDVRLGQHLTGISPHVHPFAYSLPPAAALLVAPLTWLRVDLVYRLLCFANVASVGLTAILVLRAAGVTSGRRAGIITLVALASGTAFLPNWYGQLTPLLALAGAAALLLYTRGRPAWAGGVAAVALMKPQLSLLALLVAGCAGRPRLRRGVALGALGFSALCLLAAGPAGCLSFAQSILLGLTKGGRERTHDPDSLALDGAYFALFAGPLATALLVVTVLAVAIVGLLLLRRMRERALPRPEKQLALAALVLLDSLVLPYSHQYDAAMLLLPYILAVTHAPAGAVRRWCVGLALAAALAPYLDILHVVSGVRPLPFIDLAAAVLLSVHCLRPDWLKLRYREPAGLGASAKTK